MVPEEFSEKCIILKVGQFRESDCWVRFLSPSRGILTAFAFGGLKSRKRFPGCLEPLNFVSLYVTSNRSGTYYSLQEGLLLQRFPEIHKDLSRWGMAVNCLKFVEAAHLGSVNSQEVLRHLYRLLFLLNTQPHPPQTLPSLFRVWVTCEYGYRPECLRCVRCGQKIQPHQQGLFSVEHGSVICPSCSLTEERNGIFLSGEVLGRMHSIVRDHEIPEHKHEESSLDHEKRALQVLDTFVQVHMGLVWDSGRFRPC